MKKKTLKMAVAAMVVAAAGYGLFLNQSKDNGMSELALANVEALANNEANSNGNTGPSELFDCPLWFTGDGIHCLCQNSNPCTAVLCD